MREGSTAFRGIRFFVKDTASTEIDTLSLHDAIPISPGAAVPLAAIDQEPAVSKVRSEESTRLNSSHVIIPCMPSSA